MLNDDLCAYLCQVSLSMNFCDINGGFGQSGLSSADTVDLRSVVPGWAPGCTYTVVCGLVTFSTYC